MKKSINMAVVLFSALFSSMPVLAATTVTVEDNKTTVVQEAVPQAVVVQQEPVPVVVATTEDPRELEGEITIVDYPENQIVVQDINGREKRVLIKQGMINGYNVGDYVQIYLMADLKEAKTIHTRRTSDLEGDIVVADYTKNQIVVRDAAGMDHVVILSPGMNSSYQAGDHVRLYIVSDYPDMKEVRLIRVK